MGRVWDGDDIAQELLNNVRQQVARLQGEGRPPPTLAQVSVGALPSDERIGLLQADDCRIAGIPYRHYVFPQSCDQQTLIQTIGELNADPSIAGISLHVRPSRYLSELAGEIAPDKDVDGLHPLHLGRFLTNKRVRRRPRGADIVQLLRHAGLPLVGLHVICMGNASGLASLLTWLCLHENATVSAWKGATAWPVHALRQGDVLIIDTPALPPIDDAALKPGVVVVDARSRPDGWMQHQSGTLPEAVSLLIPVPDGVGPTTTAMRLASLVAIYQAPTDALLDS